MKVIILIWVIYAIIRYLYGKSIIIDWVIDSLLYPLRKRRVDKMFKSLSKKDRRDLWLYSTMIEDTSKWYYRSLEKFIRIKYIEPILK